MQTERQEAKKRRLKTENFSDLDPNRIGETLGWEKKQYENPEEWYFYGPICLFVTRKISKDRVWGTAQTSTIDNGRTIATFTLYGIKEISFNKTQGTVDIFGIDGNSLFIKKSGQIDGTGVVYIRAPHD